MTTDQTAHEVQIRNVLAAFAVATDIGTVDEYMDLLTADALIELAGRPPRNGSDELRAGAQAGRDSGTLGPGSHTLHLLGATRVTLDGETAEAVTPFVFFGPSDGGPAPRVAGHYRDTLSLTDKGWKLSHRRMQQV